MPYRAKKRLGQNFLKSKDAIERIIDIINPQPGQTIVEVGSGRGALTLPLAESGARIIGVEFDRDLTGYLDKLLRKHDNVTILNQDFLDYDPAEAACEQFTLVGNLPYNISSPVVEWAVRHHDRIPMACLMMQKEVGERLGSSPGKKGWSPAAIFTQLYFEIEVCFSIGPTDFHPRPQVASSVIRLTRKDAPAIEHHLPFSIVVRHAFQQRRKQLVNNLVPDIIPDAKVAQAFFEEIDLSPKVRAEELTTEQFVALTNLLVRNGLL